MNSEDNFAAVMAGDHPAMVDNKGNGAPEVLGVKEHGGAVPLSEKRAGRVHASGTTNGKSKDDNAGRHQRNGSMTGALLAAPGYSPSFASLGDTHVFESHHAPRYSDTFEGFEPPRLSHSQEVQETPKVTRPEGLNFSTSAVNHKIPEGFETKVSDPGIVDFSTPTTVKGQEGGVNQESKHLASPIANLVENRSAVTIPSPPCTLPNHLPAQSGVNSFSFIGPPQMTETREMPPESHFASKRNPGHELVDFYLTTNNPSAPLASPIGLDKINDSSFPAVEITPSHSGETPSSEILGESQLVLDQSKRNAAQTAQLTCDQALLSAESAAGSSPSEVSDTHKIDSLIINSADSSKPEKSYNASNVAAVSGGIGEENVEKVIRYETDTVDEEGVSNVTLQNQILNGPKSFAFFDVDAEKGTPTSINNLTSKPGVFMSKLSKWRGLDDNDLRASVVIPNYLRENMANAVLSKGTAVPKGPPLGENIASPTCPILVFINSKSGGRLGSELMKHFEELISPEQTYDLSKHSPMAVLRYGVGCLDQMAKSGDECARKTLKNLRILVAGGDGTVGWCLSSAGALRELLTDSVPPVGVIPLGTGNDLSRSFGWGGAFSSTNKLAIKKCLVKALLASVAPLDTWEVVVMPAKSVSAADIHFPHAMHPQHHVPLPSSVAGEKHEKDETAPAFEGLFFNYFSIGMDAQVAYGFHHLRDQKPWLARGRTANQMIYSTFGCTQGWFCTTCAVSPRARGVSNILKLFVRRRGAISKDWQSVKIPTNIRAIVICNLHSYAGGRNPWGKPSSGRRQREGFEEQRYDDGLLEIMGLKDGWHSAFVLLEVSTAVRLCQAEAVKLELNGHARKKAYMQMDGEPWMQPLGSHLDEPTVVMIEKLPYPSVLLKRK